MNDHPPEPGDLTVRLGRLNPLAPTPDLMRRLRKARPTRGMAALAPAERILPGRRIFQSRLVAVAAVVLFSALVVAALRRSRPAERDLALSLVSPEPAAKASQASVESAPPPETPSLFLPVGSSQRLVSLHPIHLAAQPDEAPRRLMRAVLVDDVTLVGAQTDAVLVHSRAREVYFSAGQPIY